MPPQWTQPLDVAILSPPPPSMNSPTFDYEAQFRYPLHDVPSTPSMTTRIKAAENRIRRNASRPQHSRPSHAIPHPRPTLPRLPRLFPRTSKSNRPPPILRLNRLHPPLPSNLSRFATPVPSEFLRVSTVAAKKYATPPDPADDHDHSFFELPSVFTRAQSPHHHDQEQSPSSPNQEPRRRNIQYLIERYNNDNPPNTKSPSDPRSPTSSTLSPTPLRNADTQDHQFNIRSVRDIFERHTQQLPEHTHVSLSSVTDSASPSDASHPHLKRPAHTNTPPSENRPRRIAFADLSNTLDLSPCASSTNGTHPDDRQVPILTPPSHRRSSTVFFPENMQQPVERKKSFSVFRPVRRGHTEGVRSKSFANGETYPIQHASQASARRATNAERPRKKWVSRHVRSYGGSVRRRFESFRNMISADDY